MAIDGTADIAGIRLSKGWTGYPDEKRDGKWKSEISNDVDEHKSLMIVGNKSGGGVRKVRMYDDVQVGSDLGVGGVIKMGDTNLAFKDDWIRLLSNPADLGSFNRGFAGKNLYAHENIYGKKDMAIDGNIKLGGALKIADTNIAFKDGWIRLVSDPANPDSYNRGLAAKELYALGKIYGGGNRDIIAELDDLKRNVVRKDKIYAIQNNNNDTRLQLDSSSLGAKGVRTNAWGAYEQMKFIEG